MVKVKNFLSNYQNVFFIDGVFANTIQKIKDKKFCFCHIDVDVYDSVLFVLDFIYDKVNSGGVILFDDYGDFVSAGAKKAVDEYFLQNNIMILLNRVDNTGRAGIKLAQIR